MGDARVNRVQPSIVPLDPGDGSQQIEWHCRGFDIEVVLTNEGFVESVYVNDHETGFVIDAEATR